MFDEAKMSVCYNMFVTTDAGSGIDKCFETEINPLPKSGTSNNNKGSSDKTASITSISMISISDYMTAALLQDNIHPAPSTMNLKRKPTKRETKTE